MSDQRQPLSPAERDRLLIRDLVFAPPGPGITGTLEELQVHHRDKMASSSRVASRQGGHDVGV
ncbi:hypothetical protein NPJ88_018570 [Halomonas elongata]|uniref:hypothetical protein n=1 Tax=Halomonas elongata TaxID=2746 RepID=UPI00255AC572|nr:hypothetical protein [Halomonas elongata]MDL4864341.1 hypothetical protein [Halomonas elongata]